MDFLDSQKQPPPILVPWSLECGGLACPTAGIARLSAALSTAWLSANRAVYYPFTLACYATAYQLLFWVGNTSAGNIDVGIYDSQKNRIISSGSTAMSATVNTVQELNIADTLLSPGGYLLAVACSSGSGTCFAGNSTVDEAGCPGVAVYEQDSAFPLPDPCVPVDVLGGAVYFFAVGIQFRASPF